MYRSFDELNRLATDWETDPAWRDPPRWRRPFKRLRSELPRPGSDHAASERRHTRSPSPDQ